MMSSISSAWRLRPCARLCIDCTTSLIGVKAANIFKRYATESRHARNKKRIRKNAEVAASRILRLSQIQLQSQRQPPFHSLVQLAQRVAQSLGLRATWAACSAPSMQGRAALRALARTPLAGGLQVSL